MCNRKSCLHRIPAIMVLDLHFPFVLRRSFGKKEQSHIPASSANPGRFCSSKTTLVVPSSSLKTFLSSCQDDLSTYWQENICAAIDCSANHLHCILVQAASCNQHRFAYPTSDSSFTSTFTRPDDNFVTINPNALNFY